MDSRVRGNDGEEWRKREDIVMKKLLFRVMLIIAVLMVISACKSADSNIEIKEAPIHEVSIRFAESAPIQVFVHIQGGLSDGCTTFREIKTSRSGDTIDIKVLVQRPKDRICTQVYGYFEKDVNLGTNFVSGRTYTVKVNTETKTFVMQ